MHNLTKVYSELLNFLGLSENARRDSLRRIFVRDIEENDDLSFKNKPIRPIRGEEPLMQTTFSHLTTTAIDVTENGRTFKKRIYENDRSERLHWILPHLREGINGLEIFSVDDGRGIRTYVYNRLQRYVIILEPYRKPNDYYLITAYLLEPRNVQKIENKIKRRLPNIH